MAYTPPVSSTPQTNASTNEEQNRSSTTELFSNSSNDPVISAMKLILSVVAGAIIGGFVTSHILEAEYKQIVTQLRSDHSASISQVQTEFRSFVTTTAEERKSKDGGFEHALEGLVNSWEEEVAKVKSDAAENERIYREKIERDLQEKILAFRVAHEGMDKVNDRLKTVQPELVKASERLRVVQDEYKGKTWELQLVEKERAQTEKRLKDARRELEVVGEELDRRDIERAECDGLHRRLLECHQSLKLAKEGIITSESPDACQKSLEQAIEEKLEVIQHREVMEARIAEMEIFVHEQSLDTDFWREKVEAITEKIKFRNRKEVLEQYGPGPYRAELSFYFPSSKASETIVLELAPLDEMPHTIHTLLNILEKQLYNDGSFIMNRGHVLVAGPVDMHDTENNRRLEEKMTNEGYYPDGALLFTEYSENFPHLPNTLGFNPEQGGPVFYINLVDNSIFHGPNDEKDGEPCFAKVVEGVDILEKIRDMSTADGWFGYPPVYMAQSRVLTEW